MKRHARSGRSARLTLLVAVLLAVLVATGSATSSQPGARQGTPTLPGIACTIPARFVGADLERLPLARRKIALTFDGGSGAAGVHSILDTLQRYDVPATFFLTGQFARTFPRKTARIGRLHLVGNHTDTHADLTKLSNLQIRDQLRRAHDSILAATGQDPRRFFRFPFGARNARTIAVVNNRCYVAFRWTVDTLGWKGTSAGISTATVVHRVLDAAEPGAIVLMHVGANPDDGSTLDADALPTVITRLRARGYSFVRLSAVMSEAP